ncbi:hypothetical protein BCR32DRAFT_325693 [Anaeromyces robustus]|uniref:Uncharacterized protein n=1 Tax=Anaeromyces robustus TaxID=1754192 RepID=A0A1Y1XGW8_9FUNG|nr:hypothetical protein BCR32DRAFT_325693 [Anaeromyces robustus]|eukprot:ORX84963.1 hypothetical protein BCR32DRAFT_325693 [Anaeromyces robustus]
MTKFEVKNSEKEIIYKCKLQPIRSMEHKVTDSNDKTIAKFKMVMNTKYNGFNLIINSKNGDEKIYVQFQLKDVDENTESHYDPNDTFHLKKIPDTRKYNIKFYNKSIEDEDIFEVVDKTNVSKNNYAGTIFDYKIYHGSQKTDAPLVCSVNQSYSFNNDISLNIQPGIEPLFMIIIFNCMFILRTYRFRTNYES